MKGFFKTFFASLLAIAIACGGLFVLFLIFVGTIGSMSRALPEVVSDSVLVLDLSAAIQDRPVGMSRQTFIDEAIQGHRSRKLSLNNLLRGIDKAASDERVEGILLTGSVVVEDFSSGFAVLKEVKEALQRFKESGKKVWAFTVYPSSRDLYVMSVADKIWMNPEGVVTDLGMIMSYPYFGGFAEKYGIGVQITRAGEYKAAAESYVLEEMSAPSRRANKAVLEDFWNEYLTVVAQGAGLEPAAYEAKLNELGMLTADDALEIGLVDELLYTDELIARMQGVSGVDTESKSFRQTSFDAYLAATIHPMYSSDGFVAVVYAEGSIVHGEGKDGQIGGEGLAREIRKLRQDERVKALVLRVNSPGGSALASEVIQREVRLAKESFPVVVSMGNYAASGGYWISAYADRIFAQPNTLTGSIGVIGVFFNFEELAATHGINFDSVKTTEHADLMSTFKDKSEEEMALVQRQVDRVYDSFLHKVSQGRGLDLETVRSIAEGRIWSGVDALEIGLVDELGGLREAIAFAGEQAGLGTSPALLEVPKAKNFLEELLGMEGMSTSDAQGPAARAALSVWQEILSMSERYNDPTGVYAELPYAVSID